MLHKGFFGAEKGVFLAPQRSGPKTFACGAKKIRLRRKLPILRANAAKKKGKFYDTKKNATKKTSEKGVFLAPGLNKGFF